MFDKWAELYDHVYRARGKDYAAETAYLIDTILQHHQGAVRSVLDVACGTGEHLRHFLDQRPDVDVAGVDRCESMLRVARRKLPQGTFEHQDMVEFTLDRSFDVILCLFASIASLPNVASLHRAVHTMADHLRPGGLLLIEPGVTPDRLQPPQTDVMQIDEPDLRLERHTSARHVGQTLEITFSFNVTRPHEIGRFTERHRIRLFSLAQYRQAMLARNLHVKFDERGPAGQGLFIGQKPE